MTPPAWIVFILALLALSNHIVAFFQRITIPRAILIPRAIGAAVVMSFYGYLHFVPDVPQDVRSLIIRWSFVILFAPEGYPITYLLARRWVKHGNRDN